MMPHLVMSPFDFGRVQVQFGFTFESGMHRSEEQNEGKKMEVDSVVAFELQPTKPKVIFSTEIFLVLQMFSMKHKVLHPFKPLPL
jgi:hypothetical protein